MLGGFLLPIFRLPEKNTIGKTVFLLVIWLFIFILLFYMDLLIKKAGYFLVMTGYAWLYIYNQQFMDIY